MNIPTLSLRTKSSAPGLLTDGASRRRRRQMHPGLGFRLLAFTFGLSMTVSSLMAQQNQTTPGSPEAAWSSIQQLVQNLADAVQSKNLHGIHEPSMKIRLPIRELKHHSSALSADTGKKMITALKQLDDSVTDLHSASDAGNQKEAESALKEVQTAFDQLKSLDPDATFKSTH